MTSNPFLGILLHALGGLAAASFYLPLNRVKGWQWESLWLISGFFSWLVAPLVAGLLICPNLLEVFLETPPQQLIWTWIFGALWGVGGLTFGLSVRFLGQSLGYALSLGFCAACGTVIPPIFMGEAGGLIATTSGQVTLGGVAVCLLGIAICGLAGGFKENELSQEAKEATVKEFDFMKGLWVAVFAGVMSACMAFAFKTGAPMQELAQAKGAPALFSNLPILIIAFLGGLTTNFVYCLFLNLRKKSYADYTRSTEAPLAWNYLLCAAAGITWYFQFFFYSMGTTQMGAYDFSSWTIHMAFIIAISNLWGLLLKEWQGTRLRTRLIVVNGIVVLILATVVVGLGNYLAQ